MPTKAVARPEQQGLGEVVSANIRLSAPRIDGLTQEYSDAACRGFRWPGYASVAKLGTWRAFRSFPRYRCPPRCGPCREARAPGMVAALRGFAPCLA